MHIIIIKMFVKNLEVVDVFLKGNLISFQEAAYQVLSLPLSKSTRGFIFTNTKPLNEEFIFWSPIMNCLN